MFVWVVKIDLTSVQGSELTCFLCAGRNILDIYVWNEIELFFVWLVEIDLI